MTATRTIDLAARARYDHQDLRDTPWLVTTAASRSSSGSAPTAQPPTGPDSFPVEANALLCSASADLRRIFRSSPGVSNWRRIRRLFLCGSVDIVVSRRG
jgi:hypothetical protein